MANLLKKSLHICSMERYKRLEYGFSSCSYSVQAINFTELLSFSATPIIISFSRYQPSQKLALSQDEYHVLREVDSLEGDDVPYYMSFGVFRSHIVLAGGKDHGLRSTKVYLLETNHKLRGKKRSSNIKAKSKRTRVRVRAKASDDIPIPESRKDKAKASDDFPELQSKKAKPKATDDFSVPQLQSEKYDPKLMEIQGKLYVIDLFPEKVIPGDSYACFEVFDPQTGAWANLPNPPAPVIDNTELSCAVVGTKVFVCSNYSPVYCFDVAKPTRPWKKFSFCYVDGELDDKLPFGHTVEVDLEEDNSKLLLFFRGHFIRVFHMNLSKRLVLEYVATMELDAKFLPFETSFTHLGGQKLCIVLFDDSAPRGPVFTLSGVIFTFEISFSKSAATSPGTLSDDPYFRIINPFDSNGTSFSAKTLGWRPFEYHWHDQEVYPVFSQVIGLAVRPLSHQEHALCRGCRTYFVNTEYLSRHLSIHANCRLGQPVIQCKFCRLYFPKQELSAHFSTSMSCKSKFTYSSLYTGTKNTRN